MLFIYKYVYTEDIKCNFEEVYKDSSIQKGFFLLKDEKLRYQYNDVKLYTLVYFNQKLYIADNNNYKNVRNYESSKTIIPSLLKIYRDFPKIKNNYHLEDLQILIEKNSENNFIKRLAIKSNRLNMSIYFLNCEFKPINDLFFKVDPIFQY